MLVAWCCHFYFTDMVLDDIIDKPGSLEQQVERLNEMRRNIERAYAGET